MNDLMRHVHKGYELDLSRGLDAEEVNEDSVTLTGTKADEGGNRAVFTE